MSLEDDIKKTVLLNTLNAKQWDLDLLEEKLKSLSQKATIERFKLSYLIELDKEAIGLLQARLAALT